jgi:hypothetical protein
MKLPRRRYWVPFALLLAFLAIARFDLHYHLIGWWRGDAYFRGMPTSYWRDAAVYRVHGPPKWLDVLHRILRFRPFDNGNQYAIFKGDPKSAGVMSQLLNDQSLDPAIRERLIVEITGRGNASEEMAAAVRPSFQDGNDRIKLYAAYYLLDSESDSALAMQHLIEFYRNWAHDSSRSVRRNAALHISSIAYGHKQLDRRAFLAILHSLEQDSDREVREAATQAVDNLSK